MRLRLALATLAARSRRSLGAETFQRSRAEGEAMGADAAAAYALEVTAT